MRIKAAVLTLAGLAVIGVAAAATPARGSVDAPGARTAKATIEDFEYEPRTIRIAKGGKVSWTNEDFANHTVTFKRRGPRDLDNLSQDQTGTVRFRKAGRYRYVCEFHPNMRGVVVVR